jgi:hypothetical protein
VRARVAALALLWSGVARGSNVLEIPDNGSEAMARGGAWIAKASDPLATIFNPAGLAGQTTQVTLQTNLVVQHTCFSRVRAANDTSIDPLTSADGRFPRVCNDIEPALNPQLGASVRLSERLGLGLLVYGPAAAGRATWPEFVDGRPAPQRYLLTRQTAVLVFPTVGVGWRVLPDLRIGVSAGWGIAHVKSALATVALASGAQNADNDILANLQVKDLFVPRITAGAIWNVTRFFDLAGTWQWTDRIRARGDLGTATSYWSAQNARGDDSGVGYADTVYSDRAELSFGYGHTFIADARREDRNASGIGAIAGTAPYRTAWPVNLGTVTNAVNTVNVGVVVGF